MYREQPLVTMLYISLLCLGVMLWLLWDFSGIGVNYKFFKFMIDEKSGAKYEPRQLFYLEQILNKTTNYVERTDANQRLYDLEYNLNLENPWIFDYNYSTPELLEQSSWPVHNETRCGQHLDWIVSQLFNVTTKTKRKHYSHIKGQLGRELTQLMDSYGKPPAGLYSGLIFWPGAYKQCNQVEINSHQPEPIKTRYCSARMRPQGWTKDEIVEPKTTLRIGICLPESCSTTSSASYRSQIESLIKYDLNEFYSNSLEFDSIFCVPDERSPMRKIPTGGRIYLLVVGLWLLTVLVASLIYELMLRKQIKQLHLSNQHNKVPRIFTPNIAIASYKSAAIVQIGDYTSRQWLQVGATDKNQNTTISDNKSSSPFDDSFMLTIIRTLSIRQNLKNFAKESFSVNYREGQRVRVNLNCFSSIKILMSLLVILGHGAFISSLFSRSLSNRVELNVGGWGRLAVSITRCVDLFFVIFGLLATYTLMRKFTARQLSNPLVWLSTNLGVLIRIWPLYALVYCYSRLIAPYTSHGPWWDYGVDKYSLKSICTKESYWNSVPYFALNNDVNAAVCNPPSWFLVSYMQIFLLIPVITFLFCRFRSSLARISLVIFMVVMSALQIGFRLGNQRSVNDGSFALYGGFLVNIFEKFQPTGYMSSLSRLGSVTIGCFVGHYLREYEIDKRRQIPAWLTHRATFILPLAALVGILFLPLLQAAASTTPKLSLAFFIGANLTLQILWPFLTCLVLIGATTTYNHFVVSRFLGHAFWNIFNRLGLCIYLIHWELLMFVVSNNEQAAPYGFLTDTMKLWSTGAFMSIVFALAIHILFEAPLAGLTASMGELIYKSYARSNPQTAKSEYSSSGSMISDSDESQATKDPGTPNIDDRETEEKVAKMLL